MADVSVRDALLKAVGFNMALELTIRASVSFIFRILMGVVAGLPPTAISVNASVAFGLTAALEVPTGLWADRIGPLKTIRLGCAAQALACLSMGAAIAVSQTHLELMWILIVLEGVFDAVGNTLLSGARETFYQGLARAQDDVYRETLLLKSERFGRYIPTIAVPVGACLAVATHIAWGAGHAVILLLAVGWLVLRYDFGVMARKFPNEVIETKHATWSAMRSVGVRLIRGAPRLRAAAIAQALGWFAYILVNSYLSLDLLRHYAGKGEWAPLYMTAFYTCAFAVARFARSYLLPGLAKRLASESLMLWGGAAVLGLGMLGWGVFRFPFGTAEKLVVVAIFLILFDTAFGLLSRSATGIVLVGVESGTQATALSLLNAVSIGLQAFYSVALTTRGIGVPSAAEILGITAAIGALVTAAAAWTKGGLNA